MKENQFGECFATMRAYLRAGTDGNGP